MKMKQEKIKKNVIQKIFQDKALSVAAIVIFMSPLTAGGIVSIFDTDKTVSELENRTLKSKPGFSFASIFDGSYSKNFEEYYSDTFPFRDLFLSINRKISSMFTQRNSSEGIVAVQKTEKNDFAGETLVENNQEELIQEESSSQSEESSTPEISYSNNDFAKNGYILVDSTRNAAMEMYSINAPKLREYAEAINKMSKKILNSQVHVLLAPTAISYYSPESYHTGSQSQLKAINIAYDSLCSNIKKVDAFSELELHTNEYIYFRTDHHWTARGAYYGYKAFSQEAKIIPKSLESYQSGIIEDFVGSMYRYTENDVLKNNPDFVEYFEPQTPAKGIYYMDDALEKPYNLDIISKTVSSHNKYLCFIQGDTGFASIKTNNKNDKRILVIKESYGNAFVPFLVENYEEIYVVDPRKIKIDICKFINDNKIQDTLVINYVFVATNNVYMDAFSEIISF